jgi:2'-5' RNA ligase
VILGCHSLEEAKAVYLRNYEPGWRIGKVTPLTWPQFKRWAFNGDSSRSMWETDSVELPQKQAAAPYYDWDGTLIPRINGPAGAYLKALAELAKLTPTGETLKGGDPVDLLTARPPLFHPAIRQTASRLGLDIGEILHAAGPKSEILGPTGRNLVDDDDEVIKEVNDALGERAIKVAAEFTPDLDDEAMQEAYDAIYGKSKPQLAGMAAWPKEWMPPGTDPLGWVNWYKSYLAGTRTDDDDRQIGRWKQFKARHGSQFQRNPTPRRAFALRYWAIDPLKLLPEEKREAFAEEMENYRAKRTANWMREKTAAFSLPDLQRLAAFLNQQHSAGIVLEGTPEQIEQQILRFLGGTDPEVSAMLSAAKALETADLRKAPGAPQEVVKIAGSAPKGNLMAMIPPRDTAKIVAWAQENIPEHNLAGSGLERDSHVTVLYGYDADVKHKEVAKQLPDKPVVFRLGKIKRFPASEHRPDSDVLVVEVESEDLQDLNAAMRKAFEGRYTNSYPTYTPHLTLAYVKPGASKNLDGHARFEGETYVCDEVQYSTPEAKSRHTLSLK